jgi:hypothetical protein
MNSMVVRSAPVKSSEEAQAVPNEVIVQIAPDSSPEEVDAVRSKLGAKLLETTETLGLELWSVPDKTADRLIAKPG